MDEIAHAHVLHDCTLRSADAPVAGPTYARLHPDHDVLLIGAPGLALAAAELTSGARVVTLIVYALPQSDDPEDEAVGMAHNMTVDAARSIARGIDELCDAAEAEAAALAATAIDRARGR